MATVIAYSKKEQIGYITIREEIEHHPCTLDWTSLAQLEEAIGQVREDPDVHAVVVRSKSSKSFIVGANIAVLETLNADLIQKWVKNGHRIFNQLQLLEVPVIAVVEKYCLGGGLELAMACDFILASTEAKFAQPEASLGVMPGWGGSYRLAKYVGMNRSKEMFFTGEQISAQQAYEWGLVNHVYKPEEIDAGLQQILDKILKNDAKVQSLIKEVVNHHNQNDCWESANEEAVTSAVVMGTEATQGKLANFFASREKK